MSSEFVSMKGPEQVEWFNSNLVQLGGEQKSFKPVKKFRTTKEGAKRCEALTKALNGGGSKSTEKASNPKKERKAIKIKLLVEGNPRRIGTGGNVKYAAMMKWLEKNPSGDINDLFASTDYKRGDFNWDIAHKHIAEI